MISNPYVGMIVMIAPTTITPNFVLHANVTDEYKEKITEWINDFLGVTEKSILPEGKIVMQGNKIFVTKEMYAVIKSLPINEALNVISSSHRLNTSF